MKIIKNSFALILLAFINCHSENNITDDSIDEVKTPVTVTNIENSNISETISLNAISLYQKKNTVKANSSGYIEKVFVKPGDHINTGEPLFIFKTKEAEALGQLNGKDSLFGLRGIITISAPSSGIITEITKQVNDYLTEGDQLAIVAEQNSFVFLLNVPFELNKNTIPGTACKIILPDSTVINGTISNRLSFIDPLSQTQSFVVKPQTNTTLPENLLAVVRINKNTKQNAQVIQKSAVLTDETMENTWVMKLINDSTAVKVPVETGIISENVIEILSPKFSKDERIIDSGNYGLSDTAFVIVNLHQRHE